MGSVDPSGVADDVDSRIRDLADPSTVPIRRVRSWASGLVRDWPGDAVLDLAHRLRHRHRWVAYELVYHHAGAMELLDEDEVIRLGEGIDSWAAVDTFCRYVAGAAWQRGQIEDAVVMEWGHSPDRWWRRAALVATVPLNLRAAGGTGDRERTLAVCSVLVDDRDDMVVKAMSWALRQLVVWDPDAVQGFLDHHGDRVAPRVRREVTNRMETGRKDPRR